jgi:DNA polymerase III sliding clamp (beta) subunit (PCNA family)
MTIIKKEGGFFMKIKTTVKILKEKVGIVGKASNSSSVSGLSEQILFDVKGGVLTLTCYDNNKHFMITTNIDGAGVQDGKTLLEYKTLSSLLGKLKLDDIITIETQETKAVLRSGRTRLTLDTKNAESFAVPAAVETTSNIVVDSDTLKSMVKGYFCCF